MKKLLELRKVKKMTQQQVADALGVSRQAYANYETGSRKPDPETLKNLANLFDVSVDYILDIKEKPDAQNDELNEYLEELKNRPDMRMLFSLAKGATKEDVEQAVAIIEALRKTKNA